MKNVTKNVLMLKAGEAATSVRLQVGDYDRLFLQSLGLEGWRFDIVSPYQGAPLPKDPRHYQAILMTGSPFSVTQPAPWMQATAAFLLRAADLRVPVLGVCFGHQLLALAHGGSVQRHPGGRELGTVEIALTAEGQKDALFEGVSPFFTAQTTHEDSVVTLPRGATLLASNGHSRVQAMAMGPFIRSVQFHPEVEPESMASMIAARASSLGEERVRSLTEGLRPSPSGRRILRNFLTHFAGPRSH